MAYYIGQAIGFIPLICCIICPFFKQKWQMLVAELVGNLACAVNFFLIGETGSAILIYLVAVAQSALSMSHVLKQKPISRFENILFLVLYVGCGCIGFKSARDLLPIAGSALNSLSTFERDEQKTRYLTFANATLFFYCLIVGSTALWSELLAMITSAAAAYKYRRKNNG